MLGKGQHGGVRTAPLPELKPEGGSKEEAQPQHHLLGIGLEEISAGGGGTAAGGGGEKGGENGDLAAAVNALREEVAITNTLYREIASQPIIIKVGDQPIKKLVNQGIGDKIIAAVRANASTAGG